MAPEQALALPTDARADLYSLGCILFRVLSGAPPFRAAAPLEVLRKQIEEPAPPVTSPHGPLPDVLVGCVARALAKRPDDRFRNAGEMRAVLELALVLLGGTERTGRLGERADAHGARRRRRPRQRASRARRPAAESCTASSPLPTPGRRSPRSAARRWTSW